jgi:hypothetical protein
MWGAPQPSSGIARHRSLTNVELKKTPQRTPLEKKGKGTDHRDRQKNKTAAAAGRKEKDRFYEIGRVWNRDNDGNPAISFDEALCRSNWELCVRGDLSGARAKSTILHHGSSRHRFGLIEIEKKTQPSMIDSIDRLIDWSIVQWSSR